MARQWSSTCSQSRTLAPSPYRESRAPVEEVRDEQRDDLLGELVRPVVVRAAGHHHGQLVGAEVGPGEQVAACLRGGVRRVGLERPLLVPAALRDRAVDLVCRDVHEPLDAVAQRRVEQGLGADHVGLDEVGRVQDRAVDVGLGREVDHGVGSSDQLVGQAYVEDVAVHEAQPVVVLDGGEVGPVAGVAQLVEHHHAGRVCPAPGVAEHPAYVMAADEAGTPGDEQLHAIASGLVASVDRPEDT